VIRIASLVVLVAVAGCPRRGWRRSAGPGMLMLLASACGGATSTKTSVAQNASAIGEVEQAHRVDLEFALGNKPFPLPIVHGKVGGVPTLILVDTGANAHIISSWLAHKAQLTTKGFGDVGVDHTGHAIETRRAPHPQMHIDNWGDLPDEPMLVTDVPDAVTRLGIGAFLSPQQLSTEEFAVVLDFQKSEMRQMRRAEALDSTSGSALALDPPRQCLDKDSPLQGLAYVLHGQIEGQDADLMLDTGAHHSDLLASSKAAKALLPKSEPSRESVYAASGKVTPRTVKAAQVRVGAVDVTRDIDLIPGKEDEFCPRDGVLAMDVLKNCVIVLDRRTVGGLCTSDVKDTPAVK
jgi:hypothetical protein